jgi:hypothetical protein
MLEWAAAAGEIDLKYLDESGFCAWSEPSYTYYKRGEQKRLEQTKRRGRRLSIVGLFQHEISFVYGLVIGGVDRKAYIKMMESRTCRNGKKNLHRQVKRIQKKYPSSDVEVWSMDEHRRLIKTDFETRVGGRV